MAQTVKRISSIQTANKQYDTGDKPLLLLCDDMQYYVCKHSMGGNGMSLLCEYMAASFLRLWQLPVPDFSYVSINYEHVKHFNIPKQYVERFGFASKYERHYQEVTQFTENPDVQKQLGYMDNREDFIKIALFDLWLANEDRSFNNYNLLIDVQNNYRFVAIDHGAILNTRMLNNRISLLRDSESLLQTPMFGKLFKTSDFSYEYTKELKEYFYICVHECKRNFHEILEAVPDDWNLNIKQIENKIIQEVFSPEWEEQVLGAFFDYINIHYTTL